MSWYTMDDDQRRRAIADANEHQVSCRDFSESVGAKYWTVKDWASRRRLGFNGRSANGKYARVRGPKNPELLERVRELAEQKLSAEQIRAALCLSSRNIVVGLCARHGIQLKGGKGGGYHPGPKGKKGKLEDRAPLIRKMHKAKASDALIAIVLGICHKTVAGYREELGLPVNVQPRGSTKSETVEEAPSNNGGIRFLDTGSPELQRECRWIDGDPLLEGENLRCCGEPTVEGMSYCAWHASMVVSDKAKRTGTLVPRTWGFAA